MKKEALEMINKTKSIGKRAAALLLALSLSFAQFPAVPALAESVEGSASEQTTLSLADTERDSSESDEAAATDDTVANAENNSDSTDKVAPTDSGELSGDKESAGDDSEALDVETSAASSTDEPSESTDSEAEQQDGADQDAAASEQQESNATESEIMLLSSDDSGDPDASRIYSSVESLVPGTYDVLANVSMREPIEGLKIRAYATNPYNPESINGNAGIPNSPATGFNAVLTVAQDGTAKITVKLVNPVFTVQSLGTGSNISVVETATTPIEQKTDDDAYNSDLAANGITTRIASIEFELKDLSGTYHLNDCVEFATTLRKTLNKDLDLDVDLENAVRRVEGDFTARYENAESGFYVDVKAESSSESLGALSQAQLSVEKIASGQVYDSVQGALSQQYSKSPAFTVYCVSLVAGESDVSLDSHVSLELGVSGKTSNSKLYGFDAGRLDLTATVGDDGAASSQVSSLGYYVLVDPVAEGESSEWVWTWSATDAGTGVGLSFATAGTQDYKLLGFKQDETVTGLDWYSSYFKLVTNDTPADSFQSKALQLIGEQSAFDSPVVSGMYSAGITAVDLYGAYVNQFGSGGYVYSDDDAVYAITVPNASATSEYYLVMGAYGAGPSKAIKLKAASVYNGSAYLKLTKENTGLDNVSDYLFNSAVGYDGSLSSYGGALTDDSPYGYIAVVDKAPDPIEKPGDVSFTYSGDTQCAVPENEGYEITGTAQAVDAGSYSAIVTLKDGYVWADGSTSPVVVTWTINKAQLTVEFKDTTITQGQELGTGSLEITGFVNGETLLSVQQSDETFQMPTVSNADVNTLGSRVVYPSGGVAKNYTFIPKPGTLTVKTAAVGTLEPGTYSITANIYMPGENNPILTNTDVYANNPNNPFGIIDENDASTVNGELAPTTGLTKNATLVVGEDGTKTLILPIQNPVFTTQAIGTCTELSDVWVERVSATGTYPSGYASENGKYGAYSDRIHKMGVTLTDTQVSGTKVYEFTGSKLYAVPLDLEFAPSGTSLKLVVNYDELTKISDSTTNPFPNSSSTDTGKEDGKKEENTDKNQNQNQNTGDQNQNSGNSSNTGDQNQSTSTTVNGHLKAGTYTVTANIWVSRASSGLPLSPHITSGIFPPKDPVTDNATLVVDDSGRCILYLPIQIQSKVMTVQSVNGLNVIGTSGGGALTQVVIDLGVLENPDSSIVRSCSVSITMGSLASTISGITGSHTWDATFELNLSGLPSSGGETIPAGYLDKLTNATSDVAGVTTEDAAAAALEALDEEEAAEGEKNGPVAKLTTGDGKEKDGVAAVEEAVEEALETNPAALVIGLLLLGALLGAGILWLILLAKRRKKDDEEKAAQAGEGAGPKDPTA